MTTILTTIVSAVLAVIILGLGITIILMSRRIQKLRIKLKCGKINYDNMEDQYSHHIKSLNDRLDRMDKLLNQTTAAYSELEESIIEFSDELPKSFEGKLPDLTTYKDFRTCWLKFQNEAFKQQCIKIVNNKIIFSGSIQKD